MSKYLETKKGSIESAVLEAMSPAQQAAIAISKKEKEKEEEKLTDEELSAKQKKIDLNKNGKVDGDDLKKLRAKADKKEEVKEELSLAELAAKHIADMWAEASKSPKKEEEEPKSKKETKTTMTGKPMSDIEVSPKDKEED